MNLKSAITAIERNGILLVFPLNNKKEPASLWSVFYPRSKMIWEWDSGGDNRVANLWHLREELSRSGKVVYVKWYQGRATFFSKPVFSAMLRLFGAASMKKTSLNPDARLVLETLESDSPLSTKQLKALTDLKGRANETRYTRALKELFTRLLIVGFGEVDEGAFPSLAIGATRVLFEELWTQASELSEKEAFQIVEQTLPKNSLFLKYFVKALTLNQKGTSVASPVVHYD